MLMRQDGFKKGHEAFEPLTLLSSLDWHDDSNQGLCLSLSPALALL